MPAVTVISGGPVLKRSARAGAAVLAAVNLLGLGIAQPAAAHTEVSDTATTSELFGDGTTAPTRDTPVPITGFRDDTVITGLTLPTTIKFAPNGDIFVAEKSGLIKRYTSLTDTSPDLVGEPADGGLQLLRSRPPGTRRRSPISGPTVSLCALFARRPARSERAVLGCA